MTSSILEPVGYRQDSSYVIQVQGIAKTPVYVPKPASRQLVLKAVADFITSTTKQLKDARSNNRATLRNLT